MAAGVVLVPTTAGADTQYKSVAKYDWECVWQPHPVRVFSHYEYRTVDTGRMTRQVRTPVYIWKVEWTEVCEPLVYYITVVDSVHDATHAWNRVCRTVLAGGVAVGTRGQGSGVQATSAAGSEASGATEVVCSWVFGH